MAWRKTIGQFVIYLPLIGLLALAIYSLCIGATTSDDGIERDIRIWKDALILSAIIGEIGSLIVVRQFNILLTGNIIFPCGSFLSFLKYLLSARLLVSHTWS